MSDIVAEVPNFDALKCQAIGRAVALSKQLAADHADLLQHQDCTKAAETMAGIQSVARAIKAADRLQVQLKGD